MLTGSSPFWRWRELGYRLPAASLFLVLALLFIYPPSQLTEILVTLSGQSGKIVFAVFLPLSLVACVHLAFIAKTSEVYGPDDWLLAVLPTGVTAWALLSRWGFDYTCTICLIAAVLGIGLFAKFAPLIGRRHFNSLLVACLALYASATAITLLMPQLLATWIGSLGILIIGLALLSVAMAAVQLGRRVGYVVVALFLVASFVDGNQQNLRRLPLPVNADTKNLAIADALSVWLDSRPNRAVYEAADRPYPVVVAAAAGGGIVASAHAFLSLELINAFCPSFGEHVFSATGVSGGAFGLALYAASAGEAPRSTENMKCGQSTNPPSGERLLDDHLAHVLAALLFVEVPDLFIPGRVFGYDRSMALEDSFGAYDATLSRFMSQDQAFGWDPAGRPPALSFVATDRLLGKRFVFAPMVPNWIVEGAQYFSRADEGRSGGVSIVSAAGSSARFPWITPTARVDIGPSDRFVNGVSHHIAEDARVLADGGYFDDSGVITAHEIYRQIEDAAKHSQDCVAGLTACQSSLRESGCRIIVEPKFTERVEWKGCDKHIFLVMLPLFPDYTYPEGYLENGDPAKDQSQLFDPIQTMLHVRDAKGELAISALGEALCNRNECGAGYTLDQGYFPLRLPTRTMAPLPLGWTLSRTSLEAIAYQVGYRGGCGTWDNSEGGTPEDVAARERHNARVVYGCVIERMAPLFDLDLDPTSGPYLPPFDGNQDLPNVYRPDYTAEPFPAVDVLLPSSP